MYLSQIFILLFSYSVNKTFFVEISILLFLLFYKGKIMAYQKLLFLSKINHYKIKAYLLFFIKLWYTAHTKICSKNMFYHNKSIYFEGMIYMYENTRRHYRVAKKDIYEDPYEGIYVTKEEQQKYLLVTAGLVLLSFIGAVAIILKKK